MDNKELPDSVWLAPITAQVCCNNVSPLDTQYLRATPERLALSEVSPSDGKLEIADYEEVLADHRRLVREIDVILNGVEGAAEQASLCDIVSQLKSRMEQHAIDFAEWAALEAEWLGEGNWEYKGYVITPADLYKHFITIKEASNDNSKSQ